MKVTKNNYNPSISSDNAEKLIYQIALINALALMACADGVIEEAEVDSVINFIESDDDVEDKTNAISMFTETINELEQQASKSKAFFKLRVKKSLGELKKLSNQSWRDNIFIMAEGVYESKKLQQTPEDKEMLDVLRKELQQ